MYEANQSASKEDMEALAVQKAQELFQVCDKEQKGFINKKDMQRLQAELALDPDQLEAVFDSLDDDGNGFLTLEEFIDGFGSYLGFKSTDAGDTQVDDENVYEGVDEGSDEILFKEMLNNVGASRLYDDEKAIQGLWSRLRREDGDMASNFEDFLYKVSNDIRKSKVDFETLESALKSKSLAHDEEVRKLYEEMELQIKQEKERILTEEQLKEQQIKDTMEEEIREKDRQLQDLLLKHQEMEEKLSKLNLTESETKQENEKLQREKEDLQVLLGKSEEGLEESKSYIDQLRHQSKDEKRERARAALKVTEGIALERESLVKQLDSLRDMNQQLRDDKDEAETRREDLGGSSMSMSDELHQILETEAGTKPPASKRREQLSKQGSILGNYFPGSRGRPSFGESVSEDTADVEEDDDIEVDYDDDQDGRIRSSNHSELSDIVESSNLSFHQNGHSSESRKVNGSQGNTSEGDSEEKNTNDVSTGRSRKVRKTKRRLLPGTAAGQSRADSLPRSSIDSTSDGEVDDSARDPGDVAQDTERPDHLDDDPTIVMSGQFRKLEQKTVIESKELFVEKSEDILEVKPKETLVRKPKGDSEKLGMETKEKSDEKSEDILEVKPKETLVRKPKGDSEKLGMATKEKSDEKTEDILEVKPKETLVRKPKGDSEKLGMATKEKSDEKTEDILEVKPKETLVRKPKGDSEKLGMATKEKSDEKTEDILEVKPKETLVRKPKGDSEKLGMATKEKSDEKTEDILEVKPKETLVRKPKGDSEKLGMATKEKSVEKSEDILEVKPKETLVRKPKGDSEKLGMATKEKSDEKTEDILEVKPKETLVRKPKGDSEKLGMATKEKSVEKSEDILEVKPKETLVRKPKGDSEKLGMETKEKSDEKSEDILEVKPKETLVRKPKGDSEKLGMETKEKSDEKSEDILEVKPKETLVRKPKGDSEKLGMETKEKSEISRSKLEPKMEVESKELYVERSGDILEVKPKEKLVRKLKEESEELGMEGKEKSDQFAETSVSKLEAKMEAESKELYVEKSEDILEVKPKETLARKIKEKSGNELAMKAKEISDQCVEKSEGNVEDVMTTNVIVEAREKLMVEQRKESETHVQGRPEEIEDLDSNEVPGATTKDKYEKTSENNAKEMLVLEYKEIENCSLRENLDEKLTGNEHTTEKENSNEKMDFKTYPHLVEQLKETKFTLKEEFLSKSSSEEDEEIDTTVELNYKHSVTDEQVDVNDLVQLNTDEQVDINDLVQLNTDEQVDINDLVQLNTDIVEEATDKSRELTLESTDCHSVSSDRKFRYAKEVADESTDCHSVSSVSSEIKARGEMEESVAIQTVQGKHSFLEVQGEEKMTGSPTELTDYRQSGKEDVGFLGKGMATTVISSKEKQSGDKGEVAKLIGGAEGADDRENIVVEDNKDKSEVDADETQKMTGPLDEEVHDTNNQLTDLNRNTKQSPYQPLGSKEEDEEVVDLPEDIQIEANQRLKETIITADQNSSVKDETVHGSIVNQLSRETIDTTEKATDTANRLLEKTRDTANQLSGKTTDTANHQLSVKTTDTANQLSEKTRDTANQLSEKTRDTANQLSEKTTDTVNQLSVKTTDTANQLSEKITDTANQLSEKTTDKANQLSVKTTDTSKITDTTNQFSDANLIRSAVKTETGMTTENTQTRSAGLESLGEGTTDEGNVSEKDVRFDETQKNEEELIEHHKDESREDKQVDHKADGDSNKQRETDIDVTLREETSRKLKNESEVSLLDLQNKMNVHSELQSTEDVQLSAFEDLQPSKLVSKNIQTPATVAEDVQTSATVVEEVQTFASVTKDVQTSATVVKDVQTSATVAEDVQTSATVVKDVQTSAAVAEDVQTCSVVTKDLQASDPVATDIQTSAFAKEVQTSATVAKEIQTSVSARDSLSTKDLQSALDSRLLQTTHDPRTSVGVTEDIQSSVDVGNYFSSGSLEVASNVSQEVTSTLNSVVVSKGLQPATDLQSPLGSSMELQSALDSVVAMEDRQLSVKVAGDGPISEVAAEKDVNTISSPNSTVLETGTNNTDAYMDLKAALESVQVHESIETSNTSAHMDLKAALESVPESLETAADLKDADLYLKTTTKPEIETKDMQYTVPVDSPSLAEETNGMKSVTRIISKFSKEINSSETIDGNMLSCPELRHTEVLSEVGEQDQSVLGSADTGKTEEEQDATKSPDDNVSIDISVKDKLGKTDVASSKMKPDTDSDAVGTANDDDTFSTTMIIYTNKFEGCDEQTRMEETREALESTVLSYPEPKYYSFMPYNRSKRLYGTLTTSGLQERSPAGHDLSSGAMFRSPQLTAQTGVFDGSLSSRVNSIPDQCHGKVVERKGNKSVHFQDSDGTIYTPPHTLASHQTMDASAVSKEPGLEGSSRKLHVLKQGQEEQTEATPDIILVSGTKVEIMSEEKPSVAPEKKKKKSILSSLSYILPSVPFARGIILDTWEGEEVTFHGELGDIFDDNNEEADSASPSKESPDQGVANGEVANGPRGQPVGAVESDGEAMEPVITSQRVFKVVFVGDSGVGKSSFIHRFCNNSFNPSFSATIGVDFQVKTIQLKDTIVVLQLWDTAGQERFRSITKQYFRKADGVIVMYDVTSESSFINVRNWMTSIKENVDEKTVIEILGNKTDLTEGDDHRVVRLNDGKKLSMEYEALFFECSAKSGINIQESMAAMADLLKDKEDEELEKALQLQDDPVEKKKCCK